MIGLPGPRADDERECHVARRPTRFGWGPIDQITCYPRSQTLATWILNRQEVRLRAVSRRITRAQHAWEVGDSALWRRAQDSVTQGWQAAGGRRIKCELGQSVPTIRQVEHWQVGDGVLRLVAYRFDADTARPREIRREWYIQLDAYPDPPRWCTGVAPA